MLKQFLITLSSLIIFTGDVASQNYSEDIKNSAKVFASPKLILNVSVNVYASYSETEVFQNYRAEIRKDGDRFYSKMDNTKMLINDKYVVLVYDFDKRVVCSENDRKSRRKNDYSDPGAQIDSLLLKYDSVAYHGISGNSKRYTIYSSKSLIRRTEVYIDNISGYLKSLVYYYNEQAVPFGNKVRVDYTVNTKPSFSADEFSEKRFVNFSGTGNPTGGKECPGYQVIFLDPKTLEPQSK
jgi:hypothetical protein